MSAHVTAIRQSACFVIAVFLVASQYVPKALAEPSTPARESAVKAAYLSKFASFVEWPAAAAKGPGQPLIIGVLGNDAVADDLDQIIRAKTNDGNVIILRRLSHGETMVRVHVLFIGSKRGALVQDVVAQAVGPVLVVTDQEDGLHLGGVLNFVVDGNRIRFTVSLPAAEARGLRLSARLLAVAQAVEGGAR